MKTMRTLVGLIFLLAGSLPALPQSGEDAFQQLRTNLSRVVERELELVKDDDHGTTPALREAITQGAWRREVLG